MIFLNLQAGRKARAVINELFPAPLPPTIAVKSPGFTTPLTTNKISRTLY